MNKRVFIKPIHTYLKVYWSLIYPAGSFEEQEISEGGRMTCEKTGALHKSAFFKKAGIKKVALNKGRIGPLTEDNFLINLHFRLVLSVNNGR